METEARLKEWVRQHKVTFEVSGWQELAKHEVTTVGFELRLFGRHDSGVHADPGRDDCLPLFDRLQAIAEFAFPKEDRPTKFEIAPYDASLHHRRESDWEPEIELEVHIVHRGNYLGPVDECERECSKEIQRALRDLGVQPRVWSDEPGHQGAVSASGS